MTDAEFRLLMRHSDKKFKTLLFALRETGCRPKEARTLKWESVLPDRWVLRNHKTVGKTQRPRVVFLTAPVRKLMAVLRRDSASDHVFLNARGTPWTVSAMRLRLTRIKRKTDLPKDVVPYLLRHAFATSALVRGVDIATVAELMGHSDVKMVASVYGHLADEQKHLQDALEQARACPGPSRPSPSAPCSTP